MDAETKLARDWLRARGTTTMGMTDKAIRGLYADMIEKVGPSEAELFFFEHAGFSFDPKTETPDEGRWGCARSLAAAESRLKAGPFYVDHEPDSEPWDADVEWDGPVWVVSLYRVDGSAEPELLGSLGGVGCEDGDPYLRVVAAQLADEYLPADVNAFDVVESMGPEAYPNQRFADGVCAAWNANQKI